MENKNLIGTKNGTFTVVGYSGKQWLLECSCGHERRITHRVLTSGSKLRCIKCHHTQFIGKKYGKLTVLSVYLVKYKHYITAHCICECGKTWDGQLGSLVHGFTRSCGCLYLKHRTKKVKCSEEDKTIKELYKAGIYSDTAICEMMDITEEKFCAVVGKKPEKQKVIEPIPVIATKEPFEVEHERKRQGLTLTLSQRQMTILKELWLYICREYPSKEVSRVSLIRLLIGIGLNHLDELYESLKCPR